MMHQPIQVSGKPFVMLPDPSRYALAPTPTPSRACTPSLPVANASFSLPPIRELLKDTPNYYHGSSEQSMQQQQQPFTQSGYSPLTHQPQTLQPHSHSHPLRPISPMAMNTPDSRSQSSSPISYEQTQVQRIHLQQQHIQQQQQQYEQQRQRQLEFEARIIVQNVSDTDPAPKEIKSGRKKRQNLPRQTTLVLLGWLSEHLDRPYPNSKEKYDLLLKTRLTIQQLDNWFINARRRKIGILRKLKENEQSIALSL